MTAGADSVESIVALVRDLEPVEIIVGLPIGMSGQEGASAAGVRAWATRLAGQIAVDVRLVDERLSSVQAQRRYREQGRSTRETRTSVDSAAAVVVLQFALDSERTTGRPPGEVL